MSKIPKLVRLIKIHNVIMRYVFNRSVIKPSRKGWRFLSYFNVFSYLPHGSSRGDSITRAFVKLGPLFVKFGQILSTRYDLFPDDIIECLATLQDDVPPFPSKTAIAIIEKTYKKSIRELFAEFKQTALASASIAQVHAARLHDGSDVVVKVLRPHIQETIKRDVSLLYSVARLVERFWRHGKRLRPVELVAEFEQTILDEQDLMREAANASQLRRNFIDSNMMYVPKIYWAYATQQVIVIERIYGTPISDMTTLRQHQVDLKRLSEYGVEIFFTQVFRDGFFHADMHPGNLFVDINDPNYPKYIGVDFGIMGTLSPEDLHYIAENLLAFFQRDYRKVAVLHVQSGWVPANTRVDQFESAIRTVSEPIFEKPLKEISFGQLLLRLFQTAERFHMEVQPQLMLLQKTLLSIESLGRRLYPDLDLWETAKPFMENWMKQQYGIKSIAKQFIDNWPRSTQKIIETPSMLFDVLNHTEQHYRVQRSNQHFNKPTVTAHRKKPFLLGAGLATLIAAAVVILHQHHSISHAEWLQLGAGGILLIWSWLLDR